MNKRTRSIATLFASRTEETELSADNSSRVSRVSSGSVRSMKDTFSKVERENEALRQSLVSGAQVREIDPALIDPSPFADRFPDEEGDASFKELLASIEEAGQEVPVLLRVHPLDPARFQIAYGHRRVRAARALERPIRAFVRALDDDALAIAQGVENSARQDLTFIERAVFAARLEDQGAKREIIQRALSVDKAETSKLLSIARAVPDDLLRFVGRAPKIGRGRWQALAQALRTQGMADRMRRRVLEPDDTVRGSDERFALLMKTAALPKAASSERLIVSADTGRPLATLIASRREARLVVDRELGARFATFIAERLPGLYADFSAADGNPEPADGPEADAA